MDIHGKPIDQRIDWLFEHGRDYSARFCSPENWLARERYRALHPTAIAVLKCMDGRINIPVATNTPPDLRALKPSVNSNIWFSYECSLS